MLVSIGLIILGVAAGILIYHYFLMAKHGGKSVASQLAELKKEHQQYQYDVAEHFGQTTQMLETLNEQYEKVQLHIQSGAELLVQPEVISVDKIGEEPELIDSPSEFEQTESAKPKDFA